MHLTKLFTYFAARIQYSGVFFYFHETPFIAGFFLFTCVYICVYKD